MDEFEYRRLLARFDAALERQSRGDERTHLLLARSAWRLEISQALLTGPRLTSEEPPPSSASAPAS